MKWEYIPSTEHHGPYVVTEFGSTVCDFYLMSHPGEASTRNGGKSRPVHFLGNEADDNARLVAEAPAMAEALRRLVAGNYGQPHGVTVPALDEARAILARIEGSDTP